MVHDAVGVEGLGVILFDDGENAREVPQGGFQIVGGGRGGANRRPVNPAQHGRKYQDAKNKKNSATLTLHHSLILPGTLRLPFAPLRVNAQSKPAARTPVFRHSARQYSIPSCGGLTPFGASSLMHEDAELSSLGGDFSRGPGGVWAGETAGACENPGPLDG